MGNTLQKIPPNHQPEDSNREFTCEICLEPTPNSERKFKNGNKCSHPFCTDCVIKYIRVQLDDNNIGDIRCPAVNCDHTLDPVACAAAVGPALFVRWCDVLCESAISGQDKWYCPDRNCNALTVDECAVRVEKAKCPNCNKLFCFKCKGVWHGRFECGRNSGETLDPNDVVLRNLAEEKKWKRCPRCRQVVELMEGCSSVKCRCGIRFCYECGREGSSHWCRCMASSVRIFRQMTLGMWIMSISTGIFLYLLIFELLRRAGF